MAQGYWQQGMAEREACFQLFYRRQPFKGDYAICCGIEHVIEYIENFHFSHDDIDYLHELKARDGSQLFKAEFLEYLAELRLNINIDAISEGTIVHPNEPLLRVTGPILHGQIIETPLINLINYATLIATKAARVKQAAGSDPVMEFGLRRAHGPDGAMIATRAAYIGGCDQTSNVLAGKLYGIPLAGTMAHSWVMAHSDELTALRNFSEAMPGSTILLVDTFNTLGGVKHAITIGKELRQNGHDLIGVRLDSGDIADLSAHARTLLDDAGFQSTKIVASGDLDEYRIRELKELKAPVDMWGVGTRLVTSYDQPSLDAAYKLTAMHNEHEHWIYKLKRSDTPGKTTNPGIQQVRRFYHQEKMLGDCIFDKKLGCTERYEHSDYEEDLLQPVIKTGQRCVEKKATQQHRQHCQQQLAVFAQSDMTAPYPVTLDTKLEKVKLDLLARTMN